MVDQLKITVIATGFDESKIKLQRMIQRTTPFPVSKPVAGSEEASEKIEEEIPTDEIEDEYEIPAFLRLGRQQ